MFGYRAADCLVIQNLFVGLLFLIAAQAAMAQSAPEFKLSAPSRLKVGQPLIISIQVSQNLESLTANLVRSKGLVELGHKRWQAVLAGRTYELKQALKAGTHELKLVLSASTENGPSKIEFPLEVRVIAPMRVEVSKDGLDANQGRLSIFAHSALSQAKIEIFDQTGTMTERTVTQLPVQNQSGSIELMFEPIKPERVFRLELSVEDGAGQWKRFKFVRWFAEIPHDDVIFESGRWEILPKESKKLEAAITILKREVRSFRASVGRADVDFDVSLYVGGMTDTVGTKADNQRLSSRRARSIAVYFRSKGLALPIFVAGFGEAGLRLPTADEVSEAQNRRAIYVLTSGTHPNLTPPSGQWQKY
jgi:outer membrane protein OmpA-like peptidoglycan-associated protein